MGKIYDMTKEILEAHGYAGYERHHYRGREMKSVIGSWNDVIGIGILPLSKMEHDMAHKKGKRVPFEGMGAYECETILRMMDEQVTAIIARPELWNEIRGAR